MGRIVGNKRTDSELDRFWRLVEKTDSCWVWTGGLYVTGYGMFAPKQFTKIRAHRYSWALAYGPIPAGLDVCHRCDNRRCVRPDHLFLGDRVANMRDAAAKKRTMRRATHVNAKLTQEKANEIRALKRSGMTINAIARQFGVSRVTVIRVSGSYARGGWPESDL